MAGSALAQSSNPRVNLKETRLANGLRVITVEDHNAPVIAVNVSYNVGSRNERQGRTGFAHLFEHMMFQGSENVGKSEHFMLVYNNGQDDEWHRLTKIERTTSKRCRRISSSWRCTGSRSDAQSRRYSGEPRQSTQRVFRKSAASDSTTPPTARAGEIQQELMYDNFAYKHSTIGSMADLNAASVEDVMAFFKMYYAPNNATLTLVGDFKTAAALALIKKNFENIPRQPDPPPVDMNEPEQRPSAASQLTINWRACRESRLLTRRCPATPADYYALQSAGQRSRRRRVQLAFTQKLVRGKEMVTGA